MQIKSYSQQFEEAVLANEYQKAEALLVSTDRRKEIITQYLQTNSVDSLSLCISLFKSKGLTKSIESTLEELKAS